LAPPMSGEVVAIGKRSPDGKKFGVAPIVL
jgi:hypothetical protein